MSERPIVATVHAPARARNAIGMLGMLSGHVHTDPSRRTVALDVVPETHLDFRVGSSMVERWRADLGQHGGGRPGTQEGAGSNTEVTGTGAVHSACACAPIGSTLTGAVTGSPNRKIMESGSAAASAGGRESIGETWIAR